MPSTCRRSTMRIAISHALSSLLSGLIPVCLGHASGANLKRRSWSIVVWCAMRTRYHGFVKRRLSMIFIPLGLGGGESSRIQYPGPNVMEAARQVQAAGLTMTLGGISIPSRVHEAERVRRKAAAGLSFFTTQVLFDSNDIVWLLQRLSGVEARIFLSFAPVSHPRDLEFLRWLGADIPADLDRFLLAGSSDTSDSTGAPETETTCFDRSLDLCQRILMDVFDNLPPDPPLIGLNIEHINKRNFTPAVRMLEKLSELYHHLVSVRASLA